MKTGKTLQELATEIQRQQENKRDFLIPANRMDAFVNNNHLEIGFQVKGGLGNAVTRMAQDVESYDRSTELESIGYQIMNQNWN